MSMNLKKMYQRKNDFTEQEIHKINSIEIESH